MSSTPPLNVSTGNPVTSSDHLALNTWAALLLEDIDKVIRSDDTLVDGIVRSRNLHEEVVTFLREGLGDAAVAIPADLSVTAAKIAASAVVNAAIASGAVTTSKIAALAITTALIIDAAITSAKIADGAVSTAKIANNAVSNAKLALMSPATIKGNNSLIIEQAARDMTPAELNDMMPVFVSSPLATGNRGLVPAPSAGDAEALKVLCANGTFIVQAPVPIYADLYVSSRTWR